MIVKTNVKLNLGLSVLRKRADGYHDIETLFVPCFDFGDTLEIITGDDYSRTSAAMFTKYGAADYPQSNGFASAESGTGTANGMETKDSSRVTVSEDGRLVQGISEDGKLMITIAREEGVDWDPLKDLCAKAYGVLAQDFDLPPVKIFLEKTAPVGAGLGGGSADAAFTLKALNELCGLNLSDQRLSEYAARLGSDCSFFIFNRPMIGSGRGEVLEPYDIDLSAYETKVLIPEGVAVSTAEAYKGIVPREAAGVSDTVSAPQCLVSIAKPQARCQKVATARCTEVVTEQCSEMATTRTSEEAIDQCPETETICGQEDRTDQCPETAADRCPKTAAVKSPEIETARCPEIETAKCPETVGASSLALREVLALPVTEWKGNLVNDFEATVFKSHPELAAIKRSLYDSGAVYASMSGSGRGEVLESYDIDLSAYETKVLIPEGVAVSTAEAYKGIIPREAAGVSGPATSTTQQARCPEGATNPCPETVGASSLALREVLALPVNEWKGNLVNDFEATVFKAHHELAAIKRSLYDSGAVYASMSGSGSALFALYRK